jgi:argininosuccinate lyase
MLTLSRFAQDILLFTTSEFNYFTIAESLTTGSSIMPQKRNLDVMEILRARTHKVIGLEQALAGMSAGLPSGYNADFGETKELFMQAMDIVSDSVVLCQLAVSSLKPNEQVLQKAMTPELFAAHAAYELVKQGMPFREAYKQVGLALDELPVYNTEEVLKASNHLGGSGNLQLDLIVSAIGQKQKWWEKKMGIYTRAVALLLRKDAKKIDKSYKMLYK